ncbi:putative reverse transcriptase domain-containing protein [Tanacetum coccineum]
MKLQASAAAQLRVRVYAGNLPRCNHCNSHHNGQCPPRCRKCQRTGHQEKDCRVRVLGAGVTPLQDVTCYGCGEKGYYKDKCPKGMNYQNKGAHGRAYVILEVQGERPEKDPGSLACIKADEKKLDDIRVALSACWLIAIPISSVQMMSEWSNLLKELQRVRLSFCPSSFSIGVRVVSPRSFKVLEKVRAIAYKLELPQELSRVHNTFHVSNLKRCYSYDPLTMPLDGLHVDDKLQFIDELVKIMDREVKQLRHSRVPIVKVRWNSKRGPEFT